MKRYVYFVMSKNDDRIKIGKTGNIVQRMAHWRNYYLLGVLDGMIFEEADVHRRFQHIQVGWEWFTLCDELIEWILRNTDQDVPDEVWKYVKRFDRTRYDDLLEAGCTPFTPIDRNN